MLAAKTASCCYWRSQSTSKPHLRCWEKGLPRSNPLSCHHFQLSSWTLIFFNLPFPNGTEQTCSRLNKYFKIVSLFGCGGGGLCLVWLNLFPLLSTPCLYLVPHASFCLFEALISFGVRHLWVSHMWELTKVCVNHSGHSRQYPWRL